jgi:hypothetical protein
VQGDSSARRRALRFPAVLGVAHIAMAGVMVATLYQIGTVSAGLLPRSAALAICTAAVLFVIGVDVRAAHHNTYSIGLKRQTAKVLAHNPDRPWWVTPLFWGLDTGLVWSTFRVSGASWILLLGALLNVAPQWSGLVYGAFFGIPLLIAVNIGNPNGMNKPGGWPLRLAQLVGVTLLTTLPLGVVVHALVAN